MKLTKMGSEITFIKQTTTHEVIVNGKEIRVYEYKSYDENIGDEEFGMEVDNNDIEMLTEEELDFLLDYLGELGDMEEGEEKDSLLTFNQ